jgi:hypothetical protein
MPDGALVILAAGKELPAPYPLTVAGLGLMAYWLF